MGDTVLIIPGPDGSLCTVKVGDKVVCALEGGPMEGRIEGLQAGHGALVKCGEGEARMVPATRLSKLTPNGARVEPARQLVGQVLRMADTHAVPE